MNEPRGRRGMFVHKDICEPIAGTTHKTHKSFNLGRLWMHRVCFQKRRDSDQSDGFVFILIHSSTTFWSLYLKREHTPAETSRRSYGSFSLNKAFVHLIKDCSFKLVPHTLSFLNPKLSIRVFLNAILIFHVRWNKLKIRKRKETHLAKLCTFHE